MGRLQRLTGSAVGHRSIVSGLKPLPGYVRRVFHLSVRLIIIGGRSAHLAYLVHKSGRKTATFTFQHLDERCSPYLHLLTDSFIVIYASIIISLICYKYLLVCLPLYMSLFDTNSVSQLRNR